MMMMMMTRFGRLGVLLLLLFFLVGTKQADANARKWPDRSPPTDDNVDDDTLRKASKKKTYTEKGKGGKYSIPHHLFKDEGA
jgi:hypothetical protein